MFFNKKKSSQTNSLLGEALLEKKLIDRILREVLWITLLFSGIYLTLILSSFNLQDPSWSHASFRQEDIHNLGGIFGAYISDVLIYFFGLSAWWFVFLMFYSIILIYKRIEDEKKGKKVLWINYLGFFLFLISSSAIEAGHIIDLSAQFSSSQGGLVGSVLDHLLRISIGYIGSLLFLIALYASGFSLFTGVSWLLIFEKIGDSLITFCLYLKNIFTDYLDKRAGKKFEQQRIEYVESERKKFEDRKPVEIVTPKNLIKESLRVKKEKQTSLFNDNETELPAIHLLDKASNDREVQSPETIEFISRLIEKKLMDFGIEAKVISAQPGPVITRYEIDPSAGVKGSQVSNLSKDLARSLSVSSVRVVETIPGKTYMGLEIPNSKRQIVYFTEIVSSKTFADNASLMTIALGKDIAGNPVVADLAKMPHLLVAGTTGSGKSVAINALILSLLYKAKADEVKMIMIDPKMLELSVYQDIPHLLTPVVTDMREAGHALNWAVKEMDRRYKLMSTFGVRNISGFNEKIEDAKKSGQPLTNPFSLEEEKEELSKLPFIVVVIDELADLMMVVGKKAEELIARIAQKARASGIHLVLATQRPSVDVITGLIKANVPVRIAFQVSSRVDSRTILDQMGAESLLGQGDMLYLPAGSGYPNRVHGAFVSDQEVHEVVNFLKSQGKPNYIEEVINASEGSDFSSSYDGVLTDGEKDPLYDQAVQIVLDSKKASISYVQRNLRIGYNRAARIIEDMEKAGLVSPMQSNGNREIIQPKSE
ncbi:MAG: DNA translocase FtsK 4TM domain-containing protein [Nitrosomonadales bacterium]